jgi:hypothetical protein
MGKHYCKAVGTGGVFSLFALPPRGLSMNTESDGKSGIPEQVI